MKPTATRTSARIEARQGTSLPGWSTPTGNNDEQRLMQALIAHLTATEDIEDVRLYCYLFKESAAIKNDLTTVKVFRRIRAQLASFRIPYMKYDDINRKWMYWNDYTLTGLTAWNNLQQLPRTPVDTASSEDFSDAATNDSEEEDGLTDHETTSRATGQVDSTAITQPGSTGITQSSPADTRQSDLSATDATRRLQPPVATHAMRHSDSSSTVPLDPSAALQSAVVTRTPNATNKSPLTETLAAPVDVDSPDLLAEAPPPPALIPGGTLHWATPPVSTPQWFQSPPPNVDLRTGKSQPTILPPSMQDMVAALTDQTDWYDSDTHTPSPHHTSHTRPIDLITPPLREAALGTRLPQASGARFRHAASDSPGLDADGFTPIHHSRHLSSPLPHSHGAPQARPSLDTTQSTPHRYKLMLDSTLESMTEHARALEDAAMERHRLRMTRSQETLRVAIQDAVTQMHSEATDLYSSQQLALKHLQDQYEKHVSDTLATVQDAMAQVAAVNDQVQQLRDGFSGRLGDLSSRLYNGKLVNTAPTTTATTPSASGANAQPPPPPGDPSAYISTSFRNGYHFAPTNPGHACTTDWTLE